MKYPNRLREWRKRRGLTLSALADAYAPYAPDAEPYSIQHIARIETGDKKLYVHVAEAFARALGIDASQLLPSQAMSVPVVGRIGAGATVIPFDDHAKGDGMDMVRCPSGLDPAKTVAVQVTGDSMSPLIQDGWLVFYSRDPESDAAAVVGQTCVVRLTDGRMLLKQVRRGAGRTFNLLSINAPMMENVELEWASPVRSIMPPDLADAAPAPPVENPGEEEDIVLRDVTREIEAGLERGSITLTPAQMDAVVARVYQMVMAGQKRAAAKIAEPAALPDKKDATGRRA